MLYGRQIQTCTAWHKSYLLCRTLFWLVNAPSANPDVTGDNDVMALDDIEVRMFDSSNVTIDVASTTEVIVYVNATSSSYTNETGSAPVEYQ
jgi:hypothetical protein